MADIHLAPSTYDTGTNDTFTTLVDATDDVLAVHQNGPASAIIAVETILGTGTTLKGSAADLATRLGVAHEASGKISDFSASTKKTFPGTVSEGCTGTTSFTASQVIRKHATNDVLESTGYTVPGSSGVLVSEGDTQTLTNKTLSAPTVGDLSNMTHGHTGASTGGILTGNASSGNDATLTGTVNDTPMTSTATATITVQTGGKVKVSASAFVNDLSGTVAGIVYMRVYRDSTANIVARTPINSSSTTNADVGVAVEGLDSPSAGTRTYTVDFVRDTGGTGSSLTVSEINLVVFAVV